MRFSLGIRSKVIFLSSFLLLIPWLGYQYVWEMESFLRQGQEKTLTATARALATALHERPNLIAKQASFLQRVEKGRDLYAYEIQAPIQLDGRLQDWQEYSDFIWHYSDEQYPKFSFRHMVGKYDRFLYAQFEIIDKQAYLRPVNSLSLTKNDHLKLAFSDPQGSLQHYVIAPRQAGWFNAFDTQTKQLQKRIQGHLSLTKQGYNIELRIPLDMLGDKLGFAVVDYNPLHGSGKTLATSKLDNQYALGSLMVPSPEIEKIVRGMSHTGTRIMVVDKHRRVLAQSGKIQQADGVWSETLVNPTRETSTWQQFESRFLHPLYYQILTRPPEDFIDINVDAAQLEGEHIQRALRGRAHSSWRLTPDKKALILSAAYPIWINDQVQGAVITEESTHGIRSLRNKALEKLFNAILAIMLIGTFVLFVFASRISNRVKQLRDTAENAIDDQGRVTGEIKVSHTSDEIGDLSRSFADIVKRLSGYTHYLENMSSRLSHELRTPVAVVRSSLESLQLKSIPDDQQKYVDRALEGLARLNKIITTMSEATRLEHSLENAEPQSFDLSKVVSGCMQGYILAYPEHRFELKIDQHPAHIQGVPEFIAQLLDKLISNATEFSLPDQPIKVVYDCSGKQACLSISNQGPLLPKGMQNHIFDSMVSVRAPEDKTQPHLGLGLYIARLICDYHQINIQADNLPDHSGVQIQLKCPLN